MDTESLFKALGYSDIEIDEGYKAYSTSDGTNGVAFNFKKAVNNESHRIPMGGKVFKVDDDLLTAIEQQIKDLNKSGFNVNFILVI